VAFQGALDVHRGQHGVTKKRASRGGNLLTDIATATRAPLVASESTVQQKLRSIRRSGYLSFAYECFGRTGDNIVIFGHCLSTHDAHCSGKGTDSGFSPRPRAVSQL